MNVPFSYCCSAVELVQGYIWLRIFLPANPHTEILLTHLHLRIWNDVLGCMTIKIQQEKVFSECSYIPLISSSHPINWVPESLPRKKKRCHKSMGRSTKPQLAFHIITHQLAQFRPALSLDLYFHVLNTWILCLSVQLEIKRVISVMYSK